MKAAGVRLKAPMGSRASPSTPACSTTAEGWKAKWTAGRTLQYRLGNITRVREDREGQLEPVPRTLENRLSSWEPL